MSPGSSEMDSSNAEGSFKGTCSLICSNALGTYGYVMRCRVNFSFQPLFTSAPTASPNLPIALDDDVASGEAIPAHYAGTIGFHSPHARVDGV